MLLKMIAVEASELAGGVNALALARAQAQPPGDPPVFRWTAHHVKEIFLASLPPKFDLDGSSKLQITCGPGGNEPQYVQLFGTTNYLREQFDFADYGRRSPSEREQLLLSLIEETFLEISHLRHRGIIHGDTIRLAAEKVRNCDFSLVIPSRKLSRVSPCRQFRVTVLRHLNRTDGESWSCQVARKSDKQLIHTCWIGERPDYLDRTDLYISSRWTGQVFQIIDKFSSVQFSLDCSALL